MKFSKGKIVGVVIAAVVIWFSAIQIMASDTYQATLMVKEGKNAVGISPSNSETLDFGELSRNTGAKKEIVLENKSRSAKLVYVFVYGSLSEIMKADKKVFELTAGKKENIEFEVFVPPSAPLKKYTARVMVMKFPKFW